MLNRFARRMKEARENEQGFTLIELLVVVIIIGILMGIAVPVFLNQRQGAQDTAAQTNVRQAAEAQQAFRTANNAYAADTNVVAGNNNDLTDFGFNPGTPVVTVANSDANTFCVRAMSASNLPFSMRQNQGQPVQQDCP